MKIEPVSVFTKSEWQRICAYMFGLGILAGLLLAPFVTKVLLVFGIAL